MTYKYQLPPRAGLPRVPAKRLVSETKDELPLTGQIRGRKASDIEEVFSWALDLQDTVEWWQFRKSYGSPAGQVGFIELDFLIYTGALHMIQLDEDWIHHTAEDKAHDMRQDALLYEMLKYKGVRPVVRIPGSKLRDGKVASLDRAKALVEEMF